MFEKSESFHPPIKTHHLCKNDARETKESIERPAKRPCSIAQLKVMFKDFVTKIKSNRESGSP